MTTSTLGLCALNVALIVVGLALLAGVGLVREPGHALRLLGLAYVIGWSAVGLMLALGLVVGFSIGASEILGACAIPTLAGLAGAHFSTPAQLQPVLRANRLDRLAGGIAAAAISIWALLQLGRVVTMGASYHQDAWGFWLPRAKSLVLFDGLDTGLGGFTSFAHPEYPPLVPAMDAVAFRFMDVLDPTLLPFQEWVLAIAFIGALAGLLAGVVRGWILWPCLALLTFMPKFSLYIGSSLADQRMAIVVAVAGVLLSLWIAGYVRDAALVLAAILLSSAALMKLEGLGVGLFMVLAASLALAIERRFKSGLPKLGALAAAPILAAIAWRLWLRAEDVAYVSDYRLSDLADPAYLVDRVDRLGTVLANLPAYVLGPDRWSLGVVLGLAAALALLRSRPAVAAFLLTTEVLLLVALLTVYWISPLPIDWYIDTSAERASFSLALFATATLPLAIAESARREHLRSPAPRLNLGGPSRQACAAGV